jgi:hypothetical protein
VLKIHSRYKTRQLYDTRRALKTGGISVVVRATRSEAVVAPPDGTQTRSLHPQPRAATNETSNSAARQFILSLYCPDLIRLVVFTIWTSPEQRRHLQSQATSSSAHNTTEPRMSGSATHDEALGIACICPVAKRGPAYLAFCHHRAPSAHDHDAAV